MVCYSPCTMFPSSCPHLKSRMRDLRTFFSLFFFWWFLFLCTDLAEVLDEQEQRNVCWLNSSTLLCIQVSPSRIPTLLVALFIFYFFGERSMCPFYNVRRGFDFEARHYSIKQFDLVYLDDFLKNRTNLLSKKKKSN